MGIPWWGWLAIAAAGAWAGTVALIKTLNAVFSEHDWRSCKCQPCKRKSYSAHKKQGYYVRGVEPDGEIIWSNDRKWHEEMPHIPTTKLRERMVVLVNNHPYRIHQIRRTAGKGDYLIQCAPEGSPLGALNRRQMFIISIPAANATQARWLVKE